MQQPDRHVRSRNAHFLAAIMADSTISPQHDAGNRDVGLLHAEDLRPIGGHRPLGVRHVRASNQLTK